jgi:hypothetical protein
MEKFDVVFALTPLSYFFLEKYSKKITIITDLLEEHDIEASCAQNEEIILSFLRKTFPDRPELYFGLMYPLKTALDYFSQENLKLHLFSSHEVTIVTDVPSYEIKITDHIKNNSSLYMHELKCEKHKAYNKLITINPLNILRVTNRKIIKAKNIYIRKLTEIIDFFSVDKQAYVISDLNYNLARISHEIRKNFHVISFKDMHKLIEKEVSKNEIPVCHKEIDENLDMLFQGLSPDIKVHAKGMVRSTIVSYHEKVQAYSNHLPEVLKKLNVKFSLFNFSSEEDFILNYLMKDYGYQTISFQHGSYIFQDSMIKYCDLIPSTNSVCFGTEDLAYFRSMKTESVSHSFGSYDVKEMDLPDVEKHTEVVIFASAALGNAWSYTTNLRNTSSDCISNWRRYVRLINSFANRGGYKLTIKLHPNTKYFMYYPIIEYLRAHDIKNVYIDQISVTDNNYFKKFGVLVFDYPETSFLMALAAGHPKIVCFYEQTTHNRELWERIASTCDVVSDEENLSAKVFKVCRDESSNVKLKGRIDFLEKYCGLNNQMENVLQMLKLTHK